MRLFNTLKHILFTMNEPEKYVFLDGTLNPEWLAVGPHEDPHTYPTLEQMAEYQADHILERGARVYLLFPVPEEILWPILEEHKEEDDAQAGMDAP